MAERSRPRVRGRADVSPYSRFLFHAPYLLFQSVPEHPLSKCSPYILPSNLNGVKWVKRVALAARPCAHPTHFHWRAFRRILCDRHLPGRDRERATPGYSHPLYPGIAIPHTRV